MRIECPACDFFKEVDPGKIPARGGNAKCPRCATRFFVAPPQAVAAPTPPAKPACPKCGNVLDAKQTCAKCGLIYEKYLAAQKRLQAERAAAVAEQSAEQPKTVATPAPPTAPTPATPRQFGYGRSELWHWTTEGRLAPAALPRALALAGTRPGPGEWLRFLEGLALWLGVVFLAAGVIFFFAFNWQKLGHLVRFGCVELPLAAAIFTAWRLGLARRSGQAALLLATLLVGALLALVGQTYQTGADPWELFALWALFVVPWVAISRLPPLWLLLLVLLNLAATLYYQVFGGLVGTLFSSKTLWWILAGMNTAALAAWELAAGRGITWLAARWPPRLVATAAAGFITVLAIWGIVERDRIGWAELGAYGVWLGAAFGVYRYLRRDLYLLAIGVLSLIVVVAVFLGRHLLHRGSEVELLLLGLIVLGLSAAGGGWLRGVAKEVEG